MRALALLFALSMPTHAAGVIVIGDSISAKSDSWPTHMAGHYKLLSQSGRKIVDYDLPRDLKLNAPFDTVIYMLGTNDRPPLRKVVMALRNHHYFLTSRGFRVIVIPPPENPFLDYGVRELMWRHCDAFGWECLDMPYEPSMTTDSVHPTAELSAVYGQFISDYLEADNGDNIR